MTDTATRSADIVADIADKIRDLAQDTNGSSVYSNNKALFGFVAAQEFMVIPRNTYNLTRNPVDGDLETLGKHDGFSRILGPAGNAFRMANPYLAFNDIAQNRAMYSHMTWLNYVALREGNHTRQDSIAMALLRSRWSMIGCMADLANDPGRLVNEIVFTDVPANVATMGALTVAAINAASLGASFQTALQYANEFKEDYTNEQYGIKWATRYADTIWCAVEYVVRVRGHHWKSEYETLYDKFMDACFEGNFTWPASLKKEHIFRTAIHPFGLRALPLYAAKMMSHGTVGTAAILRTSAAPNGMAVITSVYASISSMRSEPWFKAFLSSYGDTFDLLREFNNIVLSDKYSFHLARGIYGLGVPTIPTVKGKAYTVEEMREIGATMAGTAEGFVSAMRDLVKQNAIASFSFSNVKVFEKHAGNAPIQAVRIRNLVLGAIQLASEAKTVDMIVESTFGKVKAIKKDAEAEEVN